MNFHNLVRLIGPAPSELSRVDLMKKLSLERDRVRDTILWFRTNKWQPKPKKSSTQKKTGGKKASKATTIMKKTGVTVDQLKLALLQIQEEKKKEFKENAK